ncbi:MAG: hypothetical protein KKA84_02045 [Bacteroidetes bacterium]|nr:hypothetical protein [Bacteroidota bacterium]
MKISGITYSRQYYKFNSPILTSKSQLNERNILIINLELEDGTFTQGEAAPLPEFGSETFEEIEYSILNDSPKILSESFTNPDLTHILSTADLFIDDKFKDIFPLVNGKINFTFDKYCRELS